jgi:hypothetical protein
MPSVKDDDRNRSLQETQSKSRGSGANQLTVQGFAVLCCVCVQGRCDDFWKQLSISRQERKETRSSSPTVQHGREQPGMPQTRLVGGSVEPLFTGLYSVLVGVVVVIMVCAR